jgi:ribosomal protein S11
MQISKKDRKILAHIPWATRSPKYSSYPYLITVSFFRHNIFITAADFKGRIKVWISTGSFGFKGRDKTDYLSLITIGHIFFKKLAKFAKIYAFFKFKNFSPRWPAIRKVLLTQKKQKQLKVHFLSLLIDLHITFNGCRRKQLPRHRTKRRPRRFKRIDIEYDDKNNKKKKKKTT